MEKMGMTMHYAERNSPYFSIFFCGCKQPKSIHICYCRCKDTNFHAETRVCGIKNFACPAKSAVSVLSATFRGHRPLSGGLR